MSEDCIETNRKHHDRAYGSGYGIQFPESHIIRIYEKILKYELGMDGSRGERLLDFGCGGGVHAAYFASRGFCVFGVDSDARAIEAVHRHPTLPADHFKVVEPKPVRGQDFFGGGFDVVLANHVFYFLSDSDLEICLASLAAQLKKGGVIIATMMGSQHYFFRRSTRTSDGLYEVNLDGRVKGTLSINFTVSREALLQRFRAFTPLHVGYLDSFVREDEGSTYHHLFIGRK